MRKKGLQLGLAINLILVFITWQFEPLYAQAPNSTLIAVASDSAYSGVITNGEVVVWTNRLQDKPSVEIYAANLTDHKQFPVVTHLGDKRAEAIDGNTLIYNGEVSSQRGGIIFQTDLITKTPFQIGRGFTPVSISGDWVVWYGSPSAVEPNALLGYNLRTKAAPIKLASVGSAEPVIYGSRIVWGSAFNDRDNNLRWQISTIQIGDTRPVTLAYGVSTNQIFALDFQGDFVVYTADGKLNWLNLKTKEQKIIADNAGTVTTDGRFIFWTDISFDNRNTNSSKRRVDLKGYDTLSSSYFNIAVNNGNNQKVQARKDAVVWLKQLDNQNEIYGAKIVDILPTARVAATATTPDRFYFAEVGHTISLNFKGFWDKSGGLPVFGYPLTEEYTEVNQATGKTFTVQFFERQLFEYHPENKGTPYEVELGRLGVTNAQRRNLTTTPPFQLTTDKGGRGCSYFSETSHKVCGSFLAYWQTHGLEFGDLSISYREALALFGLPISEEFDDTTGFRTQYFERAVFEYHPENKGTPYEVLLKLLGSSELQNRGWR